MNITSQSIITRFNVEITFSDFWDALAEITQNYDKYHIEYPHTCEYSKNNSSECSMGFAREVFKASEFDKKDFIKNEVVRYIAHKHNMTVAFFGFYEDDVKVITATFERSGARFTYENYIR